MSSICGTAVIVAAFVAFHASWRVTGQSMLSPTFTAAQAAEGRSAYAVNCAPCHGDNVGGTQFGGPLRGIAFRQRWGGKSVASLFTYVKTTMPPDRPGHLSDDVHAQLVAYLLQENFVRAGNRELPIALAALEAYMLPAAPAGFSGGLSAGVLIPAGPPSVNPLDGIPY